MCGVGSVCASHDCPCLWLWLRVSDFNFGYACSESWRHAVSSVVICNCCGDTDTTLPPNLLPPPVLPSPVINVDISHSAEQCANSIERKKRTKKKRFFSVISEVGNARLGILVLKKMIVVVITVVVEVKRVVVAAKGWFIDFDFLALQHASIMVLSNVKVSRFKTGRINYK